MGIRENRISSTNQIVIYLLALVVSLASLHAHRAFADDNYEAAEIETQLDPGKVFVEFKRLSSGKIQVLACEVVESVSPVSVYSTNNSIQTTKVKIDDCSIAGRESGYTQTELNDQSNRLYAKASRAWNVSKISSLVGLGIGIFAGAPTGFRLIGLERNAKGDLVLVDNAHGALGFGVGGVGGGALGAIAGAITSSVLNTSKGLNYSRDSSAADSITVERLPVDITKLLLKNRLNYALMGIPDSQPASTSPAVASAGDKGTASPLVETSSPVGSTPEGVRSQP